MDNFNDIKLVRINVNLEENVKKWYQYKARSMGMSMSQLMAYILTNYHDQQINAQNLAEIKNMAYDEQLKNDNKELYKMMMEFITTLKGMEKDG